MNEETMHVSDGSRHARVDRLISRTNPLSHLRALGFLILVAAFSLLFIYLGAIGWPGLHWDAALYGTPVINVASGKGWSFGEYTPQIVLRPSLDYNFHGILHVFLYGVLLKCKTWGMYIFAQSWINAATFASYSLVYAHILIRQYGHKVSCYSLSLLLASISGLICISLQGRPEQPAPIILCMSLGFSVLTLSDKKKLLANGACMSLLIILSPLIGIVFAVLMIFYFYSIEKEGLRAWLRKTMLLTSTAVLGSMFLIAFIGAIHPFQWYRNILTISSASVNFEGILQKLRANPWVSRFSPHCGI